MPVKKEKKFDDIENELIIRRQKLYERALDKALTEAYYEDIKMQAEQEINENDDLLMKTLKELNAKKKKYNKEKPGSDYYWVSVSPKNDITLEDLMVKVQKYTTRKMITAAIYTYECNKNKHPHVHMLVENAGYPHNKFVQNTKNTFKKLVGNLRCIDIRTLPQEWIEDKIDYIKGDKWDKEKDEMVQYDIQWRTQNNLQQYYQVGNLTYFREPLLDGGSPTNNPTN